MSKTHSDAEDKVLLRHNARDIAWLTLNRPKAYNALSSDLMSELINSLNSIANERDIKVVVIKGAGKGFCAGHDLQEMKVNNNETFLENFFEQCCVLMQTIVNLPQPVIAQVHGTAAAAGCQLVASCDLAFADDNATFATPGVNIGLFCSTPMVAVSRKINRKKMMEMLLLLCSFFCYCRQTLLRFYCLLLHEATSAVIPLLIRLYETDNVAALPFFLLHEIDSAACLLLILLVWSRFCCHSATSSDT